MLLISSSVVPSCSARAFISSSRSDNSSSLSSFVFASMYSVSSSSGRILVVGWHGEPPLAFVYDNKFIRIQTIFSVIVHVLKYGQNCIN